VIRDSVHYEYVTLRPAIIYKNGDDTCIGLFEVFAKVTCRPFIEFVDTCPHSEEAMTTSELLLVLQKIVLFLTGAIVASYTWETHKLRARLTVSVSSCIGH
jgi:hypothetical protein